MGYVASETPTYPGLNTRRFEEMAVDRIRKNILAEGGGLGDGQRGPQAAQDVSNSPDVA